MTCHYCQPTWWDKLLLLWGAKQHITFCCKCTAYVVIPQHAGKALDIKERCQGGERSGAGGEWPAVILPGLRQTITQETSFSLSFTLLPPTLFTTSACSSGHHGMHFFVLVNTRQAAWISTITRSVTIEADEFPLHEPSKPTWGSLSFHSLHIRVSSVHIILCLERSHNANFCLSAHKFLTITNSCGHVSWRAQYQRIAAGMREAACPDRWRGWAPATAGRIPAHRRVRDPPNTPRRRGLRHGWLRRRGVGV